MPTLHLGVIDVPYEADKKSTGDVAEILEAEYHIMETFFHAEEPAIIAALEQSIGDSLEDLLSRGRPGANSLAAAEQDIQTAFMKFIDSEEMAAIGVAGVPTLAALRGINHRLKHPYAKGNPRRPSFKDTGTFEQSFRAWLTED